MFKIPENSQCLAEPSMFIHFSPDLSWLVYGDGSKPWYLVNIKIAGKWMFIPQKMVLIGIDPYPYHFSMEIPFNLCRFRSSSLAGCHDLPGARPLRGEAVKARTWTFEQNSRSHGKTMQWAMGINTRYQMCIYIYIYNFQIDFYILNI